MNPRYEPFVKQVLEQIPNADPAKVEEAFEKYENDFRVPPDDAFRSIFRRFQGEQGSKETSTSENGQGMSQPSKKVEKLSELQADDKNIVIEVKVISHNLRTQNVRGEERQIAFGMLEDMPWADHDGEKWDYKDWGAQKDVLPGSILRLEGVSVNEYQGKKSLNVNQNTRVVVLKEGDYQRVNPDEPMEIGEIRQDGMVTITGRILARRDDVIHRKDGSGTIDVVRGRIADDSGIIGFLSWEPLQFESGSLVKISNAQVKTFRNTPEINIGRNTTVEVFRDAKFSSMEDLSKNTVIKIEQLRDGSRDVECIVELSKITVREFQKQDGSQGKVWSCDVADPTGKCRMSFWQEPPFSDKDLPVIVSVTGARVRAWQGIPDITVDTSEQISVLEQPPWDSEINLVDHFPFVPLHELASGTSRVGIKTQGTVVSIREDSGIIFRCPECNRVLRDGECATHGEQEGVQDIRLRLVIDDGRASTSLLLNKQATVELIELNESQILERINDIGQIAFVQELRDKYLGSVVESNGRIIVDEQGSMLLAESSQLVDIDSVLAAQELRSRLEVMSS